ncbi:polysaccharide deacetylase family protein [Methylomonas sp. ZR1]|uniref:polysaccharide deacetylase family protein n=1 Tax=Methylomonas sp. ZR1 TaxID=1797072 RepID=UPI0014922988|nr:polysaccharide deacetylase family protein [Methylomonas sp. ZR1]NOV29168.1 hypothetical protein [Methylomonas sp. ZR1]
MKTLTAPDKTGELLRAGQVLSVSGNVLIELTDNTGKTYPPRSLIGINDLGPFGCDMQLIITAVSGSTQYELIADILKIKGLSVEYSGAQREYPAFYKRRPFQHEAVPFGTALINEKTLTGGTTGLSIDLANMFNGRPTSKCAITVAGTSVNLDMGISSAAFDFDAEAELINSRMLLCAVKVSGANTLSQAVLFVGDGGFANYSTYTLQPLGVTPDGWTILGKIAVGADFTSGSPAFTGNNRVRLRLVATANWSVSDVFISSVYVLPSPLPTVMLSFDDGYAEHQWLAEEAEKRGLPISFSIARDFIDSGADFLTSSQLANLINHKSGLFEAINHSTDNNNFSGIGASRYLDNVIKNRDYLKALGATEDAANCHAYVGGFRDAGLIAGLKAAGVISCRAVGPMNKKNNNTLIALQGKTSDTLYDLQLTALLSNAIDFATVKSNVINTATGTGLAIIGGHTLKAAADSTSWVKGYDSNNGILNLLDWLAYQRDESGWVITKWTDWYKDVLYGKYPMAL